MTPENILYIFIAAVVAIGLTVFMYGYKSKYAGNLKWLFGSLRFITLFAILLLLINPKFESNTYTTVKPKLPVLVDNSLSVNELSASEDVANALDFIKNNDDLQDRFDVSYYSFGDAVSRLDSLQFATTNTNISKALLDTDALFKSQVAPVVLITDGNQTLGADYQYVASTLKNPVFPVAVGDSTKYVDLKIEQLNTNRYAFLKNKFPVEVIVSYSGKQPLNSTFSVRQGSGTVFSKTVSFTETENTQTISFTLPATAVGFQKYTAQIAPISDERNKSNNAKYFAVEVIDQSTNVLVVSKLIHPDLGALKKAITSNEQRKFELKTPAQAVSRINDSQLVILYQPDRTFAGVYSEIEKLNKNSFTIAGLETDWNYVSSAQPNFSKEVTNQDEDATAALNLNYGTFAIENIDFDRYPPLKTLFGELTIKVPHETILEQYIDGFSSDSPMLATMELNGTRAAIWDGEGLWRWRAHSYLKNKSFEEFDNFFGKMVQYLASNKRRSRLEVSSESFYYTNNAIKISAQYFDKNFVFDPRVPLTISVISAESQERSVFPMLLRNNFFEVDLSLLAPGSYKYTVAATDQAVARSGNFTIIGYEVEKQFTNANVTKLRTLATNSQGTFSNMSQLDGLVENLTTDARFKSIQKSELKTVPLVDWKYLLALIALSLALEWFIRKYNGLI